MFASIQSEPEQKIYAMQGRIDEDKRESVEKTEGLHQNVSNLEAKILQLESNRSKEEQNLQTNVDQR